MSESGESIWWLEGFAVCGVSMVAMGCGGVGQRRANLNEVLDLAFGYCSATPALKH